MVPLISICIPAHNCGPYIGETLQSLCNQSYQHLEIIIVNDGSEDNTLKEISKINDHRINVFSIGKSGAAAARNIAYQKSNGEYIVFFDGDDIIPNDFIELQFNCINYRTNVIAVSGWGRFYHNTIENFKEEFTPDIKLDFKQWILSYWKNCNPMTTPGRIMLHKSVLIKAGLWNEELSLNDDLEFFTRIFLNVDHIIMNPAAILFYRSGINGLSEKKGDAAYQSLYRSVYLSTQHAIKAYGIQSGIRDSCANMLQSCIFEIYPHNPLLVKKIENLVANIGGSSLKPDSGGITLVLNKVFGWKITKRIKALLNL
ncbi:glycosyltransferase family 2 protein [Pedobacter sp. Leaf216]|uniref:glycosyltransferase family 2 protein n=1 Tax=Pedobacter sp. Leaf216 TaxID=1735684 RepID=UPI0009E87227|nr:glycosyltransferase family 2 protein [Pedobacter sp. Leaf216]